MKNSFPKIASIMVVSLFIIPQVTFAAWWNPFTWFTSSSVESVPKTVDVTSYATTTSTTTSTVVASTTLPMPTIKTAPKVTAKVAIPSAVASVTAPIISSLNTGSATINQGSSNSIYGQSFNGTKAVYLMSINSNGSSARTDLSFAVVNNTTIKVDLTNTVPLVTGQYNLYITNANGTSAPFQINIPNASQSNQTSASTATASALPPATSQQIIGLMQLCTAAKQDCNAVLNGYNTNAIFRSNMDILVQQYQVKLQQQNSSQTQGQTIAQCEQTIRNGEASLFSMMTPAAQLSAQASIEATCGDSRATFDQAQAQSELQSEQSYQLNQQLQQIQQKLNQPPAYTPPAAPTQLKCTTQPYWDAGVLRYSTNCNSTSY